MANPLIALKAASRFKKAARASSRFKKASRRFKGHNPASGWKKMQKYSSQAMQQQAGQMSRGGRFQQAGQMSRGGRFQQAVQRRRAMQQQALQTYNQLKSSNPFVLDFICQMHMQRRRQSM